MLGSGEPRPERGEIDRLAADVGENGASAKDRAKLGRLEETFGGVLEGIEQGGDTRETILESGVGFEGSRMRAGVVVIGETADGEAGGRDKDGKETEKRGALAGGGGKDGVTERGGGRFGHGISSRVKLKG